MSDTPNVRTAETRMLPFSENAFAGGIRVTSATPHQVVIADVPQGLPEGSVLATATDKQGEPTTKLDPKDTRVRVNGIAMRLSAAIENGFVRQNADGTFEDIGPEQFARIAAAEHQAGVVADAAYRAENNIVLGAQEETWATQIAEGLKTELGLDLIHVAAEMTANRKWPDALNKLAQRWDVPPEVMQERMGAILNTMANQIDAKLLLPRGIDPAAFRDWLANEPQAKSIHNRAFIRSFNNGDLSGYRHLIEKFQSSRAYRTPSVDQA